jgi:hypothetical protein
LKPVHSPDGSSANLTDTLISNPFRSKTQAPVDIPTIIGELPPRLIDVVSLAQNRTSGIRRMALILVRSLGP